MTQRQSRKMVRGIKRREIDADKLAFAFWCMGKAAVEAKRQREALEKAKDGREGRS